MPLPHVRLEHDYPIMEYKQKMDGILASLRSYDNWANFEKMIDDLIENARHKAKIKESEPRLGKMKNRKPQTDDARNMKYFYRQNRRKAVRLIMGLPPPQMQDSKGPDPEALQAIGRTTDRQGIFKDSTVNRPNLSMRSFRHEEVEKALRKAENIAPGNDRIAYREWELVDPK